MRNLFFYFYLTLFKTKNHLSIPPLLAKFKETYSNVGTLKTVAISVLNYRN